jgi:hypothetical protein
MNKYILISMSLLILLFSCKEEIKVKQLKYNVSIKRNEKSQNTSYAITDSIESLILNVSKNDLNKSVIKYMYKGTRALSLQLPKLDGLFYSVFNDDENDYDFSTIAWGRLSDGFRREFTLSKRLVLSAKKSPDWDTKSGIPVSGYKNDFVKSLKDEFSIELAPLLKKYNYEIIALSVEKVLVGPAGKLEFWDEIKSQVGPEDKVPYDCQLWFIIRKIT